MLQAITHSGTRLDIIWDVTMTKELQMHAPVALAIMATVIQVQVFVVSLPTTALLVSAITMLAAEDAQGFNVFPIPTIYTMAKVLETNLQIMQRKSMMSKLPLLHTILMFPQ